MGSSSETYTNLKVVPVMSTYKDLDKTLLVYDGQQMSNGMGAVLNARKRTMLTMRNTLKPAVMKRWGFEAGSTARIRKVDNDLILNHLQTVIGLDVTSIQSADVGFATKEELGHIYLQSIYPDYSIDLGEFLHSDGYTYRYITTTEAGSGVLDISTYQKPSAAGIHAALDPTYDSITISTYGQYPVETSPGIYEVDVSFDYTTYHVIKTTSNGVAAPVVVEYDTTIIGSVVAGIVNNSDGTTTTTTISTGSLSNTVYLPIVYMYLQTTDTSYNFLDTLITDYGGLHTNQTADGWKYAILINKPSYGIGTVPTTTGWSNTPIPMPGYSYQQLVYDINRTITKINDSQISVSCTATNINVSSTDIATSIAAYEETLVYKEVNTRLAAQNNDIVVKYIRNGKSYLYQIANANTAPFIVTKAVDMMPMFLLKSGGSLTTNPHMELALRELGLVGNEFNASLRDPKVKFATLGFMFDPNDTGPGTTKLMYETFRYLDSSGYSNSKQGITTTEGRGFRVSFDGLDVLISADYTTTAIAGSIGPVGTYNHTNQQYVVQEFRSGHGKFSSSYYVDVTKVRRIYRKQESADYYTEIVINDLLINHQYLGTNSASTRDNYGDRLNLARMPVIREVLLKLPFDDYIKMLQLSLTLFVYTSVTVTTKWYQSGFFQFVMVVAAVALAAVSWGTASEASYSLLSVAAAVGATAGAILAVASFMGIDLGVVGDVLQVVAIVAAVYVLATSAVNYVTVLNTQSSQIATAASTAAKTSMKLASSATASGSAIAPAASKVVSVFNELGSQAGIASEGFVTTGVGTISSDMQLFNDTINSISINSTEVASAFQEAISVTPELSTLELIQEGIGIVNKATKITSGIDNMLHRSKAIQMKNDLTALQEQADKAQKELNKVLEKKGVALMMSPRKIETGFDTMTSTPDVMLGIDNLFENLTTSSSSSTENLIWAS